MERRATYTGNGVLLAAVRAQVRARENAIPGPVHVAGVITATGLRLRTDRSTTAHSRETYTTQPSQHSTAPHTVPWSRQRFCPLAGTGPQACGG